jgi:hypothetical protein
MSEVQDVTLVEGKALTACILKSSSSRTAAAAAGEQQTQKQHTPEAVKLL